MCPAGCASSAIHHGRLFILLRLLSSGSERCAAYDLLALQTQNVDGSGLADEEAFTNDLRKHGRDGCRIVIKSRNSLELRPDDVLADAGPVRLFSIDGGHTADITFNDLALADATLAEGGIVMLDDFFNQAWPRLPEGTARYLSSPRSRLVPAGMGGNKFIFAHADSAEQARAARPPLPSSYCCARQHAFGADILVVREPTRVERLVSTKAWKAVRSIKAGRWIRSTGLRVLR